MAFLQRQINRGSISTGYDIDNSVKLEPDNSEFFQRAATGSSGNLKTWTFSLWLKRTEISHACIFYSQGSYGRVRFETDDTLTFYFNSGHELSTTRKFRDTSAWYHIVLAVDTTDGTAANRLKVYVNGVQETMSGTQPSQNEEGDFGKFASVTAQLGQFVEGSYYFAGYMAEFYWIDGIQQAPTEFGEFDSDSGIWIPKAYTGSFGNEGAYLDFADASDLGDDESGNGNDYAEQNIAAADQATDTPTNVFATGNPLVFFSNPTMATFNAITEGATQFKKGANGWETMTSSIAVTSGKWYCEIQNISVPDSAMMGITPADSEIIFRGGRISYHMGASSGDGGVAQYGQNGTLYKEAVGITYSPSPTWVGGTTVQGIALDMDNGKVYFAKENTWMNNGDPTTGSTGTGAVDIPDYTTKPYVFGYSLYANNHNGRMNFGGYTSGSISSAASDENGYGTFEYAPPSGYYALCTKNLAEYG